MQMLDKFRDKTKLIFYAPSPPFKKRSRATVAAFLFHQISD